MSSKLIKEKLKLWQSNIPQATIFKISRGFNEDELLEVCKEELGLKLANIIRLDQNSTIDQIRQLKSILNLKSGQDNRLIFISNIDSVNKEVANSLLKSIEEPNQGIYFIFTTNNYLSIMPTIRSRAQTVSLEDNRIIGEIDDHIVELAKKYYSSDVLNRYLLNKDVPPEGTNSFLEALLNINYHLIRRGHDSNKLIASQESILRCLDSLKANGNKKIILNYLALNL